MSVSVRCPQCQSSTVRKHCDRSSNCDWIACGHCGGYGWPNGTRWVPGTKLENKA